MQNSPDAHSVSEVVLSLKQQIESSYHFISIYGEVSDLHHSFAGHSYFTLSDRMSSLRCALFKNHKQRLKQEIVAGEQYIFTGSLSLYEKRGDITFIVQNAIPFGAGNEALLLRKLKEKLKNEGLFDQSEKKKLPEFIERVGVITAPGGAVIHDIVVTARKHFPAIEILFSPAVVQGNKAEQSLLDALTLFNTHEVDAIIIGRGGGSSGDLAAFNSEKLARIVVACETPIISAVGHQVDTSILDLVADHSVATPTAAAELVTKNMVHLRRQTVAYKLDIKQHVENLLAMHTMRAEGLSRGLISPTMRLNQMTMQLDMLHSALKEKIEGNLQNQKQRLLQSQLLLKERNPYRPLERGYTLIRQDNKAISRKSRLNLARPFDVIFHDGKVTAKRVETK